ncbi:MAG: LamB/YcsF family protein [Chitinophagales bacterium]|nr:LamB/YcsF family protein [Chitinophagales bacterium]
MPYRSGFDLNCDMGESFGAYSMGSDAAIMPYICSANIACGFHAGDFSVMKHTVGLALQHGVRIGAHPSFPDVQGFGRRVMHFTPQEIYDMVLYQIGALAAFVRAAGAVLQHVKPHGALYNVSAKDPAIAAAVAQAVRDFNPELYLFGLSGSVSLQQAEALGLKVCHEVFADRAYMPDGSLVPRAHPQALIEDADAVLARVDAMVSAQKVQAIDGQWIDIQADTVCIHGDGPHALLFAQTLHNAFGNGQ